VIGSINGVIYAIVVGNYYKQKNSLTIGGMYVQISSMFVVAPSQAPSTALAAVKLFPDKTLSGSALVNIYATPHHFRDGSSSKPVMLDDDDVSEALSDLTNTQMTKKKLPKSQKRVFCPAKLEGAVTGKEGFESDTENLEMSPNLLE
jgi:hypothetical protein